VICVAGSFFLAAEVRPMITLLAPASHYIQTT
jgi:hypothetical protein